MSERGEGCLWCFNCLERSLTSTERVWHLYGPISQLSAKPLWSSKGKKKCMTLHWTQIKLDDLPLDYNVWPSPIFLQWHPPLQIGMSLTAGLHWMEVYNNSKGVKGKLRFVKSSSDGYGSMRCVVCQRSPVKPHFYFEWFSPITDFQGSVPPYKQSQSAVTDMCLLLVHPKSQISLCDFGG